MTEQKVKVAVLADDKLNEVKKIIEEKKEANIVPIELSDTETREIEETFKNVSDFRTLGEKITAPIDSIIDETAKIIEKDPIMDVSGELKKVNEDVQGVYKEIIDNDTAIVKFMKKIPLIGSIVDKVDEKYDDIKFNIKNIAGKIDIIFSGFDQSYESLNKSIEMQKEFLNGLDSSLSKVKAYKQYVEKKLDEFKQKEQTLTDEQQKEKYKMFIKNVEYFLSNLNVLIGNLELARKRLLIRLDSAIKLSLAMSSSRPIFKTLLSVAILETSGQKAIDASIKTISVMGETIDKMSSDLTDKAIKSSRKTEELTSKPVLDTHKFIENVKKLKDHFDSIEQYREQVKKEAEEERKLFEKASEDLQKMKTGKVQDFEELKDELQQN